MSDSMEKGTMDDETGREAQRTELADYLGPLTFEHPTDPERDYYYYDRIYDKMDCSPDNPM